MEPLWRERFNGSCDAAAILRGVFGFQTLRAGQQAAIDAFCAGRDVQVLLATGGGKSLCYQAPALVRRACGKGPALVISPLIALMQDQVEALLAKGVCAGALHSSQDELVQREVLAHLMTGKLDLLYISPERACGPGFRQLLLRAGISLLAIDEAHCISQWGHDFRPEYLRLGELKALLGVPTMALTATATPRVMDEIAKALALIDPVVVRSGFDRPNLHFSTHALGSQAERLSTLIRVLREHGFSQLGPGRAIVYCATRKKAETVAHELKAAGFACGHYHAGRTDLARERAVRAYGTGRARILVATNAFGMGVDYPDIRVIAHFQAPSSLEAYYQEAGRAGRDGQEAHCLLFWGPGDRVVQSFLARHSSRDGTRLAWHEQAFAALEHYAAAGTCRQQSLCAHFGVPLVSPCGVCDVCLGTAKPPPPITAEEATRNAAPIESLDDEQRQLIVSAAGNLRRPVGKAKLAKALRGSHDKSLRRLGLWEIPEHGCLAGVDERSILAAIDELLDGGPLEHRGQKYPTVWLKGRPVRHSSPDATVRRRRRPVDSDLKKALESFRRRTARALRWKTYMVFSRAVIDQIDTLRPASLWELSQVRGFGDKRVARYGQEILDLVRNSQTS